VGTLNISVQVDAPPEMGYLRTPKGALVEYHFTIVGGSTLDVLMTHETATALLAAGSVLRAQVEQELARDAAH
jgi:hypothetical protein